MATTATATRAAKERLQNYQWEGLNTQGQKQRGELQALSVAAVNAELRRQGIVPTHVKRRAAPLFASLNKRPIKSKDIAIFVRQLATMIGAGIPLVQSISIIAGGQGNPTMQKLLLDIEQDLKAGNSFADALRKHPGQFDSLFVNLVDAGEQSGTLESLLDRIARYKERSESIKGKVRKALVYPAAIIFVAVVVVAVIMIFVIPEFEKLFKSFGSDLPALTRALMDVSHFMVESGWLLVLGLFIAAGMGVFVWKRSGHFRKVVDRAGLGIPVVGGVLHKAALARFARTLATTFAAGIPIVESLDSVAGAAGNEVVADAVRRMRVQMAAGQSMVFAMRQEKVFTHMLWQMAAVGEETGALDEMLNKLADFYEEEVDNMVDSLTSLLEPFIIVLIGGIVGVLVVALYLPIFNIGNVVG